MSKNVLICVLFGLVCFLFGRSFGAVDADPGLQAEPLSPAAGSLSLPPQGRRSDTTSPITGTKASEVPLVYETGSTAAGANDLVAVTGSYGVGTSVLYVLDTKSRNLAVYEARGGSLNSRRLYLVGARKIDLDLQLFGYNDQSEFDHEALLKRFKGRDEKPAATTPKKDK